MLHHRKRKVACITLLLCLLLCFAAGAQGLSGAEINVLRIGKADAIIISTAGHVALIDTGEEEDAAEILSHLFVRGIQSVDLLIVTHFDKDHVGGADGILRRIPVGAVYDAAYESEKTQYVQYVEAIEAAGVARHRVDEGLTLTLGSLTLTLIPSALDTDDDNDLSLVISMADPYHTFLFAADAEEARIEALLQAGIGPHDLLKVPHHGQTKANLEALIERVAPKIALITDSQKNPADEETLVLLATHGVDTYQTQDGDIRVVSGPSGLTASQ